MSAQNVRLRSVGIDDLPELAKRFSSRGAAGEYQWFGPRSASDLRRRFEDNCLLGADGGVFVVVAGEASFAGEISWFKTDWGPVETSWCWKISVTIAEEWRGKGVGAAAQRLIVEHLFAHTRAERIQAFTDCNNIAEQRALERAGFSKEGVIRSAQWREGRWHDQILYAILRPST